ncbi:MAG TPA: transcription antitermination factor NusB [Candidatus Baltobacteraceae bacterium]|jgi:16S rRNA (cytosine967-C5)-methyltransferase|nr:transcription antitermination factor NusB [Candidatus Baltobacteraceae bacterium]
MSARDVALAVVRDVFPAQNNFPERGAQESLDYRVRKAVLSPSDRAFVTELAYGSIKMRRTLDWYLDPFIGDRTQPLPPVIREILRLGIYELAYTEPDVHATVFEFVNLAKRYGHKGLANLTNAVFRSFLRANPPLPVRESFESEEEFFGLRYSLPSWLVRQWQHAFGDRAEAVCAAVNDPAQAAIVVNTLLNTRDEVTERLVNAGVAAVPSPVVAESLLVRGPAALVDMDGEAGGRWWHQSESSAMPVDVLNPQPGERILDVCSGRGNKALQIGARLAREGTLLCIERDPRKAQTLGRRLEQAEIAAGTVVGDATTEFLEPDQRFDRILVDAPCSGIGVVGRHPEARWKKLGTDGERLALTQRGILERVAGHVEPGGALVYAVCSTDPRETIEVVEWFLSRHSFERGLIPVAYEALLTDSGDVLVPPGIDGRDGFYIARLESRR